MTSEYSSVAVSEVKSHKPESSTSPPESESRRLPQCETISDFREASTSFRPDPRSAQSYFVPRFVASGSNLNPFMPHCHEGIGIACLSVAHHIRASSLWILDIDGFVYPKDRNITSVTAYLFAMT